MRQYASKKQRPPISGQRVVAEIRKGRALSDARKFGSGGIGFRNQPNKGGSGPADDPGKAWQLAVFVSEMQQSIRPGG